MLTVLLTRHGMTERSSPEQHLGQKLDVQLSEAGRQAAQALTGRLEQVPLERVIASPLERAFDTARIAAPGHAIETDPRLMEMDYGDWEGLTNEQIDERYGDLRRAFEADPGTTACPGGERGDDVARRVRELLDELLAWAGAAADDHRVLLVAHSTLNRVLLCVALDVPVKEYRRNFRQDWANLTVLRFGGPYGPGGQLLLANDLGHVRGLHGPDLGLGMEPQEEHESHPVTITGYDLTLEEVEAVARGGATVEIDEHATHRMAETRAVIEDLVARGEPVYGVTTGFGDLATHFIPPEDARRLQHNLLVSHAVGVGRLLERDGVRAMLLLRANTLARGQSGCRPLLVERLVAYLNNGIHPVVPTQGSVGASGDLAPLAHLALPLIGRGEVEWQGTTMSAAAALQAVGLQALELEAKEGLALLNGTQLMSAVGALTVLDAIRLAGTASVTAAMSVEALLGTDVAFAAAYHAARPHRGQGRVAAELRHLLRDSAIMRAHHGDAHKVQDPYSLRCTPQVHGASRDAFNYARGVLEVEINSATDNPLVFPGGAGVDPGVLATGGGTVISGGNFHGQPVALAMDFAKLAIAELGSISERRTALLIDGRLSGLPAFLADEPGLNSGLMLYQYTAASLVSENKVLVHPASADSIPTSANQEDHVSMGSIAARQAQEILRNVEVVVALELLCSAQGLDFRLAGGTLPGAGVAEAHRRVRERIPHVGDDRDPGPDIRAAVDIVRSAALLDLVAGA